MRRLLATLCLVGAIGAAVFVLNLFLFVVTPYGKPASEPMPLMIEPGTNLDQVAERLDREGLISNRPLFKAYVTLMGEGERIHAGEYTFVPPVTPNHLLDSLLKGDFSRRRITIPEGWTAREIANYLGGMQLVSAEVFLAKVNDTSFIRTLGYDFSTLEGFLFPDTYEIYQPKGPEEVIEKLVRRFREVYEGELQKRAREVGLSDYEVVTLASVVEKETGRAEDRPPIASVFLNRLKIGMALASDPTVIYGIPNFDGNLTKADLERPGPYNTYLNPGLPPTPIANPGHEALRAVLYPAQTDYLYFVSKNDGTHEFSETLSDHQQAVYRYQMRKEGP